VTTLGIWPTLTPTTFLRAPCVSRPFPLDQPEHCLYGRARLALFHGLRALGVREGEEVLVPAYHHGSEVEAIARAGAVPRFYAGDPRLEPDEDELETLLGPRTRALHLIHHLGFPQDAGRWRRWCDERGLLLIEDAAQAWLAERGGRAVGSDGDLAFFSVYKTVGVPDGGAAVCRAPLPRASTRPPRAALAATARRLAAWGMQRSDALAALLARQKREGAFDARLEFELGEELLAASPLTAYLLPRALVERPAEARRRNYARLLAALGDHVPPPFDSLPARACPWVFPVRSAKKHRLIERLAEAGIEGLDIWSVAHPLLEVERFRAAAERRSGTVGLPVHQGLREHDVDLVAEVAGSALGQ